MDPRPSFDLAHAPATRDLSAQPQSAFPAQVALPPVAAPLGAQLHLLVTPIGQTGVRHFTVDPTGHATAAGDLAIKQPESVVACGDALWAAGGRQVVELDAHGGVTRQRALAIAEPVRWLRVVCAGGQPELVWLTARDRGTLWWARPDGAPAAALQGEEIVEADAVGAGNGVTVLVGRRDRLEVVRLLEGRPHQKATVVQAVTQESALTVLGDRYAALWLSNDARQASVQWLDWALAPLGAAAAVVTLDERATLTHARLCAGADARLALVWGLTRQEAGRVSGRRGHIAPRTSQQALVAAYDVVTGAVGPPHVLSGQSAAASAYWLGDTLLVIAGSESLAIAPFAAVLQRK